MASDSTSFPATTDDSARLHLLPDLTEELVFGPDLLLKFFFLFEQRVFQKLTSAVWPPVCVWLSRGGDGSPAAGASWRREDVMFPRASVTPAASSSRASWWAAVSDTCAVRFSFRCCIRVILGRKVL
ncbi:hypothetical protein EYF80_036447 [Liparis tanakae]|uniref:Uncharacterized protein n=1 Tax=Liparis tanakae TaxID=230148 RepID=A0A4Z2GJH0_9TELE|nr:hypothetical protein EYF80_036447 [Liparis tanakae]